jgi:ferrochelatase
MRKLKSALVSGLSFLALGSMIACGRASLSESQSTRSAASTEKVGLLFASHGDIDNPDTQLEDYIKVSFQKNVGIPLPMWTRKLLDDPAYRLSVGIVRKQYDIIGPTRYYANSLEQIEVINKELEALIPGAKAYVGFNFTTPFIDDTLEQMRKDGVTKIVVINKGAQFSYASSGENMEDVLKWLKKNPSYDPEVVGLAHYGQDPRFTEVMAKSLREDIAKAFPGKSPSEVCILLGSHGLPQWLINTGDTAVTQMKGSVVELRKAMPEYHIYHGFLNDDFFPGAKWVSPKAIEIAPQTLKDGCKNVALDGRLSFTTHHRATQYDMNVEVKELLAKSGVSSTLLPNFDTNIDHAKLIASLTKETLEYKGAAIPLKKKGSKAVEVNSIGKPGTILFGVTHQDEAMAKGWKAEAK